MIARFDSILLNARATGQAVAAFSCYDLESATAVLRAAGVGRGVVLLVPASLLGEDEVAVAALRAAAAYAPARVCLQADHVHDLETVERACRLGVCSVMADGSRLEERVSPLASAGLYVPGGRGAYPSSVLMGAIPARVAGVERLVIVTPPRTLERNPAVAAAIAVAGAGEHVYRVGGAQAIAALAYGTRTIPAVDKIVGPGNAFVAAACELSVKDNKVKIHRIVAATDPGYAVNPAQIERQVSGSFVYGLSALFLQECTVKDGRIEQTNFHQYQSMRIAQMPKVETIVMPSGGEVWGGIGEPTICVAAPAVLNALYRATGKRIRSVPLKNHGIELV